MEETDEEDEKEEGEQSSESDKDTDSEDEDVSDWDSDYKNPWETLPRDVKQSLSQRYDKQVDKFLKEGASDVMAFSEEGCEGCTCTIFTGLKHDPVHRDVMKTRRRFMDVEEAIHSTVDRCKFLLNRMFGPQPFPTQEEEEQGEDDN